jgi:ABC-2 type transport system permease protein
VYYPVAILPPAFEWISRLLPITYSLHAMRLALLQGASWAALLPDILALIVFSIVLMPLGLRTFRYAVQKAKKEGSLTHY